MGDKFDSSTYEPWTFGSGAWGWVLWNNSHGKTVGVRRVNNNKEQIIHWQMTVCIWKGTGAIYWKCWLSIHMSDKETLINWIPKEVSKMLRFLAKMPSSKCNLQRNYLKCGWSVVFCVEGPIPKSNTKLQDELLCSWISVIIRKTSIYLCFIDLKKWSLFLLVMQDLDSFSFWAGVYLDFFTEFAAFRIPVVRNVQKKKMI